MHGYTRDKQLEEKLERIRKIERRIEWNIPPIGRASEVFESHGVVVTHDTLKCWTHFCIGNRTMSISDHEILMTVPKNITTKEWIVDICMFLNFSRYAGDKSLMHSINVNHKKGHFTDEMCFAIWELLKT